MTFSDTVVDLQAGRAVMYGADYVGESHSRSQAIRSCMEHVSVLLQRVPGNYTITFSCRTTSGQGTVDAVIQPIKA